MTKLQSFCHHSFSKKAWNPHSLCNSLWRLLVGNHFSLGDLLLQWCPESFFSTSKNSAPLGGAELTPEKEPLGRGTTRGIGARSRGWHNEWGACVWGV